MEVEYCGSIICHVIYQIWIYFEDYLNSWQRELHICS
jgi:hypothetical protein